MFDVVLSVFVVLLFGVTIMYNRKILSFLMVSRNKSETLFYRVLGRKIQKWHLNIERATTINKDTFIYKINGYFKDIIVNTGMTKDNVTPVGLLTFILSLSIAFSILFVTWSGELGLALPAFGVIFYLLIVLFRFMSLSLFERKEAEIMDTVDLISMDIKGGVYNAILRYRNNFHPNMKPYFEEFIDNVQYKGYGFKRAMVILNDQLGPTFTDFANKAILYEEKADSDLVDIFSSVVEINQHKRSLRYENNIKFNDLRLNFIISVGVISLYAIFAIWTDPFLAQFFQDTLLGKLLLLGDLVAVTAVLAYISSIKAKFL